ncbi:hypothetical protein [Caldalkalibacillus salinus]|uniref:hypothetical protein n=1 Tax=Caldalkalibacillus salinus TaxID=2803787 RepID=UPI001924AD25|nr:hypothetical protein [Caldalkalibacillus salinus]
MSLFKNKNFTVMWVGQLATIFGHRFSEIAIPLIVLQLTGSPWQAALVVVCSQIAPLVLSLPVGTTNIWIIAGSLLILGATGLLFRVSFGAMVPGVVGRKRLVSAHSYFEGADALT